MKLRDSMVFVHRWLALVAGVFWAIAALTGGMLVFEEELARLINGGRFETTEGELPPGGLDRAFAENFPDETVRSIAWGHRQNLVRATMQGEDGRRLVFIDGGSGRELQPSRDVIPLMALVRRAHTSLLAGRPGYWLVTATSAAAVISMLTGLYLWWPGIRRFFRGFAVRAKRGAYIFNFDLHQVLGVATFVLLFIMTGTGVIMGLPGASPALARALLPDDTTASAVVAPAPHEHRAGPPPGVEELAATAERAAGGRIASLAFLDGEPGRVEARVELPRGRANLARVTMARADGRVLDVFDSSRWNREARMGSFLGRWHTGAFRNLLVRILFSAACILGGVIAATGFVVWWIKRSRKRKSRESRAATATA